MTAPPTDESHGRRTGIVFLAFLLIAAFFLFTEHRAHLLGILPFLLLLACPFLHWFMHRGHGGHEGSDSGHGDSPEQHHSGHPRQEGDPR